MASTRHCEDVTLGKNSRLADSEAESADIHAAVKCRLSWQMSSHYKSLTKSQTVASWLISS